MMMLVLAPIPADASRRAQPVDAVDGLLAASGDWAGAEAARYFTHRFAYRGQTTTRFFVFGLLHFDAGA